MERRWGLVIDLRKCVGCYSCAISCKTENFVPPGVFFNRILISERGTYPTVLKLIQPVNCNHCEEAPCVEVCPTGATTKRADGIVVVDHDCCVGCRYCVIACPYQQRSFLSGKDREYFPGQGLTPVEEMGQQLKSYEKGVVYKCTFCFERIDRGLEKGLVPGQDREATPACVIGCPAEARYFGDLNDPESEVCRLIKEKRGEPFHPEYETAPSVYYLSY